MKMSTYKRFGWFLRKQHIIRCNLQHITDKSHNQSPTNLPKHNIQVSHQHFIYQMTFLIKTKYIMKLQVAKQIKQKRPDVKNCQNPPAWPDFFLNCLVISLKVYFQGLH